MTSVLKSFEKDITHYVPGGWDGEAFVVAVCGERISYLHASSLFTNCPKCAEIRKKLSSK